MARFKIPLTDEERKTRRQKAVTKYQAANPERVRESARKTAAKRRANDPEGTRRRAAEWRAAHPDRVKQKAHKWKTKNPERWKQYQRKAYLKRAYKITITEFESMLAAQNHCCAICKTNKPGRFKHWCIDHCHETGVIRQLLCHGCNLGIGYFKHDPAVLQRAIDYLKKFS